MSRYSKELGNVKLIYGFDHALGYWYEKRDLTKQDNEFENDLIEEKDSFSGLRKAEMVEVMEEFKVPEEHIMKAAMDLPF